MAHGSEMPMGHFVFRKRAVWSRLLDSDGDQERGAQGLAMKR